MNLHTVPVVISRTFFVAGILFSTGVLAQKKPNNDDQHERRWREIWAGADVTHNGWLLYSGVTVAPFSEIHADGWRVRAVGGYGGYRYKSSISVQEGMFTKSADVPFEARTHFSEALVGYQHRIGPLTAKAFAGVSVIGHEVFSRDPANASVDPNNEVQGTEIGPKGVAEFWLNIGSSAWTSLDVSWTSAHDTRSGRIRSAVRPLPNLSTGFEAIVDANSSSEDGRGGLFVRYDWAGGEVSASAGVGGELGGELEVPTTPYATVNWITQF